MDWKHFFIGAVAALAPAEIHYLLGVDWAAVTPAYAAVITGILQMVNEYVSNLSKDKP